MNIIGYGTYGYCYVDEEKNVNKIIDIHNNCSWIREIFLLNMLNHRNIIKLNSIEFKNELIFDKKKNSCINKSHNSINIKMNKYIVLHSISTFSKNDIILIFNDLINAVNYLHYNNIIHRDISDSNILIDIVDNKIQRAILCDFGISKYINKIDKYITSEIVSLPYRSPEIELAIKQNIQTEQSFKIDIWSLGMILVYLVCDKTFYDNYTQHLYKLKHKMRFYSELLISDAFYIYFNIFLNKNIKYDMSIFIDIINKCINNITDRVSSTELYKLYNITVISKIKSINKRVLMQHNMYNMKKNYISQRKNDYIKNKFIHINNIFSINDDITINNKLNILEEHVLNILFYLHMKLHNHINIFIYSYNMSKKINKQSPLIPISCYILTEEFFLDNPTELSVFIQFFKKYKININKFIILKFIFQIISYFNYNILDNII